MRTNPQASSPGGHPGGARAGLVPCAGVARLVVPLVLLAAACGGGDDGGGSTEARIAGYLQPTPFDRLVFEVDHVADRLPRSQGEDLVVAGVTAIVDKPGGVAIVHDDVLEPRGGAWTYAALQELARATYDGQPDAATVHVLIVDGRYADNPNVLGLAWDHRHIALFGDVIESSCAGLEAILRPGQAERACDRTWMAIWAHELGHVVGLVDLGAPMQEPHRELGGTHHCDDESCVMWRTHDGSDLLEHVRGRIDLTEVDLGFDDACLADLAAVREAASTADAGL
ncbi:MAG TPA: hypothetical protein RMH85_15545 [Polyangiaceae bacterium LLY-WYZ-15_(1-7)]|nr:hypothetical protein [Polyangiaceae bacterium LLY-WYZ-15_(1-7)]HJL06432.1 hypothetical protein [Polyangiaceae bacterium LLY-WYZ-15_(1-7)]HJL09914.1 hypothetical protein [Polyangiaceae bacterium LLY-WYZ-15_(1-7)]HJL24429.1 hypothetical protein [Polyangiaceae bacterium LLY-WYZ-15_(1-7)]HJL32544.1 hypothetical protein [Polyangiaceae bacterium LLY-WYZ-15_(1-7)]